MKRRFRLIRAAAILRAGGIVAYPTEGVYGLGCDPWQPDAVARLLALKRRPEHKGLILLAASIDQLRGVVASEALAAGTVSSSWPGPVTWVLPANPEVPRWLTGDHDGLAVRVSAHPVAAGLAAAFGGAIVSTSANLAGRPSARSALQVRLRFANTIALTLGGTTAGGRPTEIRAYPDGRVLRAGR